MRGSLVVRVALSVGALWAAAGAMAPPMDAASAVMVAAVPPPTEELTALRANPWQWVAFVSPVESFAVESPSRYQLTFNIDGSLTVVADCNRALGAYQGEGGVLEIVLGPMTTAACPPGSLGDRFVQLLPGAARHTVVDGHLFVDLMADGGTLEFAPAPGYEAMVPLAAAEASRAETLAQALGNLTYDGVIGSGPVALVDGVAAYSEPDSSATPRVELVDRLIASGDLDGDGAEDAVAALRDFSAGSGTFTFLAPVLDVAGAPSPGTATMLGDRIQVASVAVVDGDVVVESVVQGPGDPACCPTLRIRQRFSVEDGALVERDRKELGPATLAALDGTSWRLVALGDGTTPTLPDTEATLRFADGEAAGSGGCNMFSGPVSEDAAMPQSIAVGPLAATRMGCPEPIAQQEAAMFAALDGAAVWRYDDGWLAIVAAPGDATADRLLFAPERP